MECEDFAECVDFTVCVRPQLWSAMPSLECEEFVECEEFRVCVAGIETTQGNFGARTKIPIPKPAQTSRGTPVGSIFPSSPWVRSRGRNLLIFTQPTFKNVTFDNPVLLRQTNEETSLSKQPSIHSTSTAALERHRGQKAVEGHSMDSPWANCSLQIELKCLSK